MATPSPPAAPSNPIVDFCRAREAHRAVDRQRRGDKAEHLESKRAVGALLQDSMLRRGVQCIEIPGAARPTFVRVGAPTARPRVPRNEEELRALLSGLGSELAFTLAADVPDAVVRLLKARFKQQAEARAPAAPRISVVHSPRKTDAVARDTALAPEVRTLSEQYAKISHDAKAVQGELRAAKQQRDATEKAALEHITAPVPIRVKQGEREILFRVVRCERKATRRALGMKRFLAACREAARRSTAGPREALEERVAADVLEVMRTEGETPPASYLKLLKMPK